MEHAYISPSIITYICYLRSCGTKGSISYGQEVIMVSDIISWNALIRGYIDHGYAEEALYYFEQMQNKGILQNALTYSHSLKACADLGRPDEG